MPQTCESCHSTATWANATFNHSATGFPLTGAHVPLQCSQCHVNGNYSLTDTSCVSCHLKDYQGTTDPNHVQAACRRLAKAATVPPHGEMRASTTRHRIRSYRSTHQPAVRAVSRKWQLQLNQRHMLDLSPEGLPGRRLTRIMHRRASRKPAIHVTRPRPGRTQLSTTRRPALP